MKMPTRRSRNQKSKSRAKTQRPQRKSIVISSEREKTNGTGLLTSIRVSPPLNKKWLRPQVDQPAMRVYPDAQRSCEATSERTRYERLRRYDGCFRFLS